MATHNIKPEIVQHLIKMLRENKQTRGALKRYKDEGPAFCFQGLCCQLYIELTGSGKWDEHLGTNFFGDSCVSMPRFVRDWLTVDGKRPWLGSTDNDAVYLNDQLGWKFQDFIKALEEQ